MNKKFIIVFVVVLIIIAGWFIYQINDKEPNETGDFLQVKLYFYNPDLDQGPGGAQCSEAGLVSVERMVPKGEDIVRATIELLLRGELSAPEKAQGLTTEFPLSGFAFESADIENSTSILTFSDPENKTTGGSCRVSILRSQIEATAKQFENVLNVQILPEELFQP